MAEKRIDIHGYDSEYEEEKQKVLNSKLLSEKNKKLTIEFQRQSFLKEGNKKPTLIKYLQTMRIIGETYLKKDFDKVNKKDLEIVIEKIKNNKEYSVWTPQKYSTIIRKFFDWIKRKDDIFDKQKKKQQHEIINWIETYIPKKDRPKVQAKDILTEIQIKRLINVAEKPRDKAFISLLYELGARISEIGNLKRKDITKDEYSYLIDIKGKTGTRTIRAVMSMMYLTTWLNQHPSKDPESPVWVLTSNEVKK